MSTSPSSEQLFVNVIALKVLQIVNRWQWVSGTHCYVMNTEGEVWRNRDREVYWLVAARSRKPLRENELSVLSDDVADIPVFHVSCCRETGLLQYRRVPLPTYNLFESFHVIIQAFFLIADNFVCLNGRCKQHTRRRPCVEV
jgi:hypothetical protein